MHKIGTCANCKYSKEEVPNKTVRKLIEEGKVASSGMLRCTNRALAVHNKQIGPGFGCIYWESKE